MRKIAFDQLPESPLPTENGIGLRRFTGGALITVARVTFEAGTVLPGHRHINEQFTVVLIGVLEFERENGPPLLVSAGEVIQLAANEWHGAKALTDTTLLDIFSPPRSDWGAPEFVDR